MGSGKLIKFIDAWNKGDYLPLLTRELVEQHIEAAANSFIKQFDGEVINQQDSKIVIRASMLGYPAVELAAKKIFSSKQSLKRPYSMQWVFHLGDYFESLLLTLMEAYGLRVTQKQKEIRYVTKDGHEVVGHIDAVVEGVLVDIKTMSFFYMKEFVQRPNDDRGYITQAHLYETQVDCEAAGFVCLNKGTNQLAFVEVEKDPRYLERVDGVVDALLKIQDFDDIKQHFDIPPLEPDPTNPHKKRVPASMQYSSYKKHFYIFDEKGNPITTAW